MVRKISLFLPLVSLLCASSLAAQENTGKTPDKDNIIVVGDALPESAVVRDSIRQMRPAESASSALAKFLDPLCLGFAGINEPTATKLRRLVERRAEMAEIALAKGKCATNALIVVVDDPGEFINSIKKSQPKIISPADARKIEIALKSGDPVLSWWTQEPRTEEGGKMPVGLMIPGIPGTVFPQGHPSTFNSSSRPRRVGLNQSAAIVNSIIVFEGQYLEGLTLGQIGDYAAMRLLAPSRIEAAWAGETPPSIMRLFAGDPENAPDAMTRFDLAYLSALYRLPINAESSRLPGAILAAYQEQE